MQIRGKLTGDVRSKASSAVRLEVPSAYPAAFRDGVLDADLAAPYLQGALTPLAATSVARHTRAACISDPRAPQCSSVRPGIFSGRVGVVGCRG